MPNDKNQDLLAEIREALAKATPGPWKAAGKNGLFVECPAGVIVQVDPLRGKWWFDALLIAHAPQWLTALLDRLEAARAALTTGSRAQEFRADLASGMTFGAIAEKYGISKQRVSQIRQEFHPDVQVRKRGQRPRP